MKKLSLLLFIAILSISAFVTEAAENTPAEKTPTAETAPEAGELLGVRSSSFLWSLREHPDLVREKYQGLYVYFCSAPTRYDSQTRQRSLMRKATRLPTDSEAIAILVEKIKHPALSSVALSKRLGKQKLSVEPGMIDSFFVKHGLGVKKTPPSA